MPLRSDYPRYPRDVREKQIVALPALERRLAELHLTGYPSVVNEGALKLAHADNNALIAPAAAMAATSPAPQSEAKMEARPIELMTTNQLVARLAEMARKNLLGNSSESSTTPVAQKCSFDRSSTYRLDYYKKDVPEFYQRTRQLPDYKKNWSETDKSNIEMSKKFPFLTMPASLLKNRTTIYRHDYLPSSEQVDYRTLSHKTNLQDLGVSYAYSAYSVSDPAREVTYDKSVASCRGPRCVLWKTHSPRQSFIEANRSLEATSEALRQMRELRSLQLSKSQKKVVDSDDKERSAKTNQTILLPGMRGMGYRQAPKAGEDYIYLPRDHFCHQVVYDY